MAEGGVGAGIALNQKQHVAPALQPRQHGVGGFCPSQSQFAAIVRHGEKQLLVLCGRLKARALGNAKGVAGRFATARGVNPNGIAPLQLRPGCAGD